MGAQWSADFCTVQFGSTGEFRKDPAFNGCK